jgi:dipicolinate synthase subunit A
VNANVNLKGRRLSILGGDAREQEIARQAAAAGANVSVFGIPWPDAGITGVTKAASAADAIKGAEIALFPLPGIKEGHLYAPQSPSPIKADADLLSGMANGGHILLGHAPGPLKEAAKAAGLTIHEYEHDIEGRRMRAPAIVEGAISFLIQNTQFVLAGARIAVLAQGVIGSLFAKRLRDIGAKVLVVARSPEQRQAAMRAGLDAIPFEEFPKRAGEMEIVVSTASGLCADKTLLSTLPKTCLVVDTASPPGSVDLEAAKALGLKALWARGMGARAPITVGRAQWSTIAGVIAKL